MDKTVHRARPAHVEIQGQPDSPDPLVSVAILELPVAPVSKVRRERLETADHQVNRDSQEVMVTPDHQATRVSRVHRDLVEQLEQREAQDRQVPMASKEHLDSKVHREILVWSENRESVVALALLGSRVNRVLSEIPEHREIPESLDRPASRDHRDKLVSLGWLEQPE